MEPVTAAIAGVPKPIERLAEHPTDDGIHKQQRQPQLDETVEISDAGRKAAEQNAKATKTDPARDSNSAPDSELNPLSETEKQQLTELQKRDQEVRAHENAHRAAAGSLVITGPTYSYRKGPDGRDYAVGGEVQISTAGGRTPEETIRVALQAKRAALAPQQPSSQDRAVAAEADQRINDARVEQAQLKTDETEAEKRPDSDGSKQIESATEPDAEPASRGQTDPGQTLDLLA